MARRSVDEDDEDGDDFDSDDFDSGDYGDEPWAEEDDEPTVPCPYCREPIPEDAPRCPYCGQYVSAEDAPPPARPWWLYPGLALCFVAVYFWVAR